MSKAACAQKTIQTRSRQPHLSVCQRRDALIGLLVTGCAAVVQPAQARPEALNKEADAATSPYIQELLKRTEENKERRQKERLQDYYKRIFKDYFEFEGGDARTGRARGINPETQAAIQQWLQENK